MAISYKLQIDAPKTRTGQARSWVFTAPGSGPGDATGAAVLSIDADLRRAGERLSVVTARLSDPKWSSRPTESLAAQLPDPGYWEIPCSLYLAPPGSPRSPTSLVFTGKLTSLQTAWPAPSALTLVMTDKSIDARKQANVRAFKGKSSTQIAAAIANEYGYDLDVDTGKIQPQQRAVDLGLGSSATGFLSDWDHLLRALRADGLECYFDHRGRMQIRQLGSNLYRVFRHGEPDVLSLQTMIEHVPGAGRSSDVLTDIAFRDAGTTRWLEKINSKLVASGFKGKVAAVVTQRPSVLTDEEIKLVEDYARAKARTHRRPIAGSSPDFDGAHAEGPPSWEGPAIRNFHRKDTATLVTTVLPDLLVSHSVGLEGWGATITDEWLVQSIKHHLVGDGPATTTATLQRGMTPQGAKSVVKIPFGK